MPLPEKLQRFVDELRSLDRMNRYLLLLDYAEALGTYPEEKKDEDHLVRGCVSRVWLDADFDGEGMCYRGAAEGQIAAGMASLLINGLNGEAPETIVALDSSFAQDAGLSEALTAGRQGGLSAMLARMKAEAARHVTQDAPQ